MNFMLSTVMSFQDLNPQPLPPDAALTLSIVTYIGSVLSLLCLIAFIVTYLAVKYVRKFL